MPSAIVTSKGQITLSKAGRDFRRLGAGDRVDIVMLCELAGAAETVTFDRDLRGLEGFRLPSERRGMAL